MGCRASKSVTAQTTGTTANTHRAAPALVTTAHVVKQNTEVKAILIEKTATVTSKEFDSIAFERPVLETDNIDHVESALDRDETVKMTTETAIDTEVKKEDAIVMETNGTESNVDIANNSAVQAACEVDAIALRLVDEMLAVDAKKENRTSSAHSAISTGTYKVANESR